MSNTIDNSVQIQKKFRRILINREIALFDGYLNILDKELNRIIQESSTKYDVVEAELGKSFLNLLRQSFLTSLYSFMELWLLRECHVDSKNRDKGKSYKAIKKKGLKKAKIYFSKVMKSDYPFRSSSDWRWIANFQRLRDCIVHRQGSLTGLSDYEVDTTLAKFVDDEDALSLFGINDNEVFIDHEFCLKALQIVQKFMLDLLAPSTTNRGAVA